MPALCRRTRRRLLWTGGCALITPQSLSFIVSGKTKGKYPILFLLVCTLCPPSLIFFFFLCAVCDQHCPTKKSGALQEHTPSAKKNKRSAFFFSLATFPKRNTKKAAAKRTRQIAKIERGGGVTTIPDAAPFQRRGRRPFVCLALAYILSTHQASLIGWRFGHKKPLFFPPVFLYINLAICPLFALSAP